MWHRLTGSLWFVPGLIVLGAIALAIAMIEVSMMADPEALARFPRLFGTGADGARSMLATIAGSMITVAGVTFSVTVVAVGQASSQYTPRILRNFMRDRANQVVLGVLVGVFTYCLVVLRSIRGADEVRFVPAFAVLLAVPLAILAIGSLIFFIHHITDTLDAGSILTRISRETLRAVDRFFPDEVGDDPDIDAHTARTAREGAWRPISAQTTGYVQAVDDDGLVQLAARWNTLIRMERGVGDFVADGMPLVSLAEATGPNEDAGAAVGALFTVSAYRSVHQDAAFGLRQMVDMALRALSPGVNDTTTAISCIDHLGAVLLRLARRRIAEPCRVVDGVIRVIARGPTFESMLAVGLDEIRRSAAGNGRVLVRLLGVLESVAQAATSSTRRRLLRRHADLIRKSALEGIPMEEDRVPVVAAYESTIRALRVPV